MNEKIRQFIDELNEDFDPNCLKELINEITKNKTKQDKVVIHNRTFSDDFGLNLFNVEEKANDRT